jgi:hypothetical protein
MGSLGQNGPVAAFGPAVGHSGAAGAPRRRSGEAWFPSRRQQVPPD